MKNLKKIIKKYQNTIVFSMLFVLAFIPRIVAVNNVINIDAANFWFSRIDNFWFSIKNFQPENIIFIGHGTFFMEIVGLFIEIAKLIKIDLNNPLNLLLISKLPILLISSFFIAYSYILLSKIFENKKLSLTISFLLLIDPIFLYESRDLHLNALMTSLSILGILCFFTYLKEHKNKYLIFSGIFIALGLLTRSTALIIFISLILLFFYLIYRKVGNLRIKDLITYWLSTILLVFLLLWPDLLTSYGKSMIVYIRQVFVGISTLHELPGPEQTVLIGNLYYFIYTLIWVPLSILMLFLGFLVANIKKQVKLKYPGNLFINYSFCLILFYYIVLTLSQKKQITYLLPALIFITILSGIGLFFLIKKIKSNLPTIQSKIILTLISTILIIQIYNIFTLYPSFNYRNCMYKILNGTLMGNSRAFYLGRGEGYKEAVDYIKEKNQEKIYLSMQFSDIFNFFLSETDKKKIIITRNVNETDYIILTQAQLKKGLVDEKVINIINNNEPEKIIEINNIQYLWIYKNPYKK